MKKILLIITSLLLFSCNENKQTIKGDLYFKLVNLLPVEGFTKEKAKEIEKMLDSLNSNGSNDAEQKNLFEGFEKLRKHKLLTTPHIELRVNENDIKMVFLSQAKYKKLQKYTLDYLSKNNKKLEVELNIQTLEKEVLYSDEIINMKEIEGKTYFNK